MKKSSVVLLVLVMGLLVACGNDIDAGTIYSQTTEADNTSNQTTYDSAEEPANSNDTISISNKQNLDINQIEIDSKIYTLPLYGRDFLNDGWELDPGDVGKSVGQYTTERVTFINENGSRLEVHLRCFGYSYDPPDEKFCSIEDARVSSLHVYIWYGNKISASVLNGITFGDNLKEVVEELSEDYILDYPLAWSGDNKARIKDAEEDYRFCIYLVSDTSDVAPNLSIMHIELDDLETEKLH